MRNGPGFVRPRHSPRGSSRREVGEAVELPREEEREQREKEKMSEKVFGFTDEQKGVIESLAEKALFNHGESTLLSTLAIAGCR